MNKAIIIGASSGMPIFVTDVRPGYVDTAMAYGSYKFRVAPVTKVAGQIYNAIRHRKRIVYVTKGWCIIAFFFKMIPGWAYDRA